MARAKLSDEQRLARLIHRTAVLFSPNHEEDDAPLAPTELVTRYTTDSRSEINRLVGNVYTRAKFYLVFGEVDNLPEDGGPYCIMYPIHAWLDPKGGSWRLSDKAIVRAQKFLWENFGYVTYTQSRRAKKLQDEITQLEGELKELREQIRVTQGTNN